jgi:hypothetical protein
MPRVLVVHYSQTGQLSDVVNHMVQPLVEDDNVEVVFECVKPKQAFPFPWPFIYFFCIFPECVYMKPIELEPLSITEDDEFDLVILGYQVWFLAPSLPISSFLQHPIAKKVLKDKPVVTVIACRDMWLMGQEKVKMLLSKVGARLIDNVALVDECGSGMSFLSTPLWMFTGKRGPFGPVPKAGVGQQDIKNSRRFGEKLVQSLNAPQADLSQSQLKGMGAVTIKEKYIASETIANRSFHIWGKLLMACGDQHSFMRRLVVRLYIAFLITLILTVVPISALIKKLISPLTRKRIQQQKAYFAAPSGEANNCSEASINE